MCDDRNPSVNSLVCSRIKTKILMFNSQRAGRDSREGVTPSSRQAQQKHEEEDKNNNNKKKQKIAPVSASCFA